MLTSIYDNLYLPSLIDLIDHFCPCQGTGNVAKRAEENYLGVKVVNAWKNSGVEVRFVSSDKYVIITLNVISINFFANFHYVRVPEMLPAKLMLYLMV